MRHIRSVLYGPTPLCLTSPMGRGRNARAFRVSDYLRCQAAFANSLRASRAFCVEDDQQFSGEGNADDHLRLSGLAQPLMEGCQMRIVFCGDASDQEQDGSRPLPAAAHRTPAGPLAAVIGDRRQPGELGDGLARQRADLGQLGHQPGDGPGGDALDLAEGSAQPLPERVVIDEPGDLAFQLAALALQKGDRRIQADQGLRIAGGAPALLVDGGIGGQLDRRATSALSRCAAGLCKGVGCNRFTWP